MEKDITVRRARQYVLFAAADCDPPHGLDLAPGGRDALKVERLRQAFEAAGFDPAEPALVGYPLGGRVQLLTGTHRHEASRLTGTPLPVTLVLRSDVEAAWGTDRWGELVRDVPVRDLEVVPVPPAGRAPALEDRVAFEPAAF